MTWLFSLAAAARSFQVPQASEVNSSLTYIVFHFASPSLMTAATPQLEVKPKA